MTELHQHGEIVPCCPCLSDETVIEAVHAHYQVHLLSRWRKWSNAARLGAVATRSPSHEIAFSHNPLSLFVEIGKCFKVGQQPLVHGVLAMDFLKFGRQSLGRKFTTRTRRLGGEKSPMPSLSTGKYGGA